MLLKSFLIRVVLEKSDKYLDFQRIYEIQLKIENLVRQFSDKMFLKEDLILKSVHQEGNTLHA